MLKCPNCNRELIKIQNSYKCDNNHSFDISKYGHTNLLLSNQKNSKVPGDSKDMVLARKNFLEKGNYEKISDKVNTIVVENIVNILSAVDTVDTVNTVNTVNLDSTSQINILDIGCGEGYYTNRLEKKLGKIENLNFKIYGLDISKEAIIQAAKSHKNIEWSVASASNLPFFNESLDFIICMFAKIVPEEKLRTLKKGGKLIIVSTGENHLVGLKKVVYPQVKKDFYLPSEDESLKVLKHVQTVDFSYETTVYGQESITNLFNMTPYRWKSPVEGIKKLFSLEELTTEINVTIDIFEKE